jgi:hypothetical protein
MASLIPGYEYDIFISCCRKKEEEKTKDRRQKKQEVFVCMTIRP